MTKRTRPVNMLSWLLHRANAAMPSHRYAYPVKDRILRLWAVRDGEDVQRIVRECYGWGFMGCDGAACTKCRGTGIWSESWVALERWSLGGRIFHRPIGPTAPREAGGFIDGHIRHTGNHQDACEALLWLLYLFAIRLWWRMLRGGRFAKPGWRPMLLLQWLVSALPRWPVMVSRCACGRRFIRRRDAWLFDCRRCRHAIHGDFRELPF